MVREEMGHLRFSNRELDYVSSLIDLHMRVLKGMTPQAARRLLRSLDDNKIGYRDFLRLQIADRKANLAKSPPGISDMKRMVETVEDEIDAPFSIKDLAVTGKDVMELLDIPSGPRVGEVLRYVSDRVLDEGKELNDRGTLLAMISELKGDDA